MHHKQDSLRANAWLTGAPLKLSANEQNELAGKARTCQQARWRLIRGSLRIVSSTHRRKYAHLDTDEFFSRSVLVMEANLEAYDPSKGAWSTFLIHSLLRDVAGSMNRERVRNAYLPLEEHPPEAEPATDQAMTDQIESLARNDRDRVILHCRLAGETFQQIGDRLGVTATRVQQIFKQIKERAHYRRSGDS
ncbi:Hypothetical protein PBC10988_23230 [Planctomycetales bacterium 10988]|nr:Hypothetical protein PBC10988_23230 [Planctomycetales bacterium 10988]